MAKEKPAKVSPEKEVKEFTFTCKFCGETKPLSEMILQTRFFPVLTSCRACERTLQSLKMEELPEEEVTEGTPVEEEEAEGKPEGA